MREQRAVLAVADDVRRAARGERDDGRTGGERLDAYQPEVVLGREDETARRREEVAECRVVGAAGEHHVLVGQALEAVALAAPTDHEQAQAPLVEPAPREGGPVVRR